MGRPVEPLIDRAEVVEVALRVLDERGLDAVTMRSLAKELGVAPASLYHHFSNKDEIYNEVARLILSEVKLERSGRVSWRRNVERQVMSTLDVMIRHPHALPLLVRLPFRRFGSTHEYLAQHLMEEGLPARLVMPAMESIYALTVGTAMQAINAEEAAEWGDMSRAPNLARAVRADRLALEKRLEASVRALLGGWLANHARA